MTESPPLQLLFREPFDEVMARLRDMVGNAEAISAELNSHKLVDRTHVQHGSMGYEIAWSKTAPVLSGYRTVFFEPDLNRIQTSLSVSFGPHLQGGERLQPVAQALLSFGAKLAAELAADAVVWNPAKLISKPVFFVETVESYAAGGAFPVLALVDIEYQPDETRVLSTGLSWFSGQEIALTGAGLQGQELTRRAVRLIHDIAVNGPVIAHQYVPDLDQLLQIELTPPDAPNTVLRCRIDSKSEAKVKALTLH